ncbi:hypothetical protein NAV28_01295 [Pseudomonas stutzeri]|nr:hypothetical protein [Stutzerimonas degradans]
MRIWTVVLLSAALGLAGCSFSAPGVHARIGDADAVHLDIGRHGHGGGFCPPGHRMKGSC